MGREGGLTPMVDESRTETDRRSPASVALYRGGCAPEELDGTAYVD